MYHKGFINVILKLLSHWNLVKSKENRFEKDILWFLSAVLSIWIIFHLFIDWLIALLCPIHVLLAVTTRDVLQDLFSYIYLFVFLDGFIVREGRYSLFSRSCLDQYPVVLEFGDVPCNECSDTMEETDEWRL